MIRHHTVRVTGWVAVAISAFFVSFWSFWGTIENFHEGWWHPSLWLNIGMMLTQYLGAALIFTVAGIVSVARPRAGALLHGALGVMALIVFRGSAAGATLIALPVFALGVLYWLGRARPKRAAYWLLGGLFAGITLGFSVKPAWRVAHRLDDGDFGARLIEGNGVRLVWAPRGPGWPDRGATWAQAVQICESLSPDGSTVEARPARIWRLPSIEEAVRSAMRGGKNAGGGWDGANGHARYRVTPDKESPLWDVHSQVIYWWTATPVDEKRAWRFVYHGGAVPTLKSANWGYLGYRCVKDPGPPGGRE